MLAPPLAVVLLLIPHACKSQPACVLCYRNVARMGSCALLGCLCVDQANLAVVEQFGKFNRIAQPGECCRSSVSWCA